MKVVLAASPAAAATLALPASAAGAPAPKLTVAAYYYSWYGPDGLQWHQGYARARLDLPHAPALGEYDSRDPEAIAAHYRWAQRYGVDVFLTSWWGPHAYDDVTIRDHLLPSPARGRTKIAIFYETGARMPSSADHRLYLTEPVIETMVSDFDYLARTYFRHPGYYRIDGRPVVILYGSKIYRGQMARAIRSIREHVRSRYGLRLYLIGDEVDWDIGPSHARIGLFDAITPYTLYSRTQRAGWPSETRFLQEVNRVQRQFRRVAHMKGVRFVPGVLPAFNDRGVRPEARHYVLPHEVDGTREGVYSLFNRFLEQSGQLVDSKLRLITVTSWNEWHEDTQIEPTAPGPPSGGGYEFAGGYTFHAYEFALLERLAAFKRRWEAAAARRALRGVPRA
jgi:glycoprotein endo-alpha-1,2-mannosidase